MCDTRRIIQKRLHAFSSIAKFCSVLSISELAGHCMVAAQLNSIVSSRLSKSTSVGGGLSATRYGRGYSCYSPLYRESLQRYKIPFFGSYKYLHGPGVFESGRHTQHGWESQSVGTDHEHPGSHLCSCSTLRRRTKGSEVRVSPSLWACAVTEQYRQRREERVLG